MHLSVCELIRPVNCRVWTSASTAKKVTFSISPLDTKKDIREKNRSGCSSLQTRGSEGGSDGSWSPGDDRYRSSWIRPAKRPEGNVPRCGIYRRFSAKGEDGSRRQ